MDLCYMEARWHRPIFEERRSYLIVRLGDKHYAVERLFENTLRVVAQFASLEGLDYADRLFRTNTP